MFEYERIEGNAWKEVQLYDVVPVREFTPADIKAVRAGTGMTQAVFACVMGVSAKAVEAWESGRKHPNGTACRLLELLRSKPLFVFDSGIVAE